MLEDRNALIKALFENEAFLKSFYTLKNIEDVQELFSKNGVEISLEDLRSLGKALTDNQRIIGDYEGELTEEELEDVAGGAWYKDVFAWKRQLILPSDTVNASACPEWYKA